jgi:hypothetical protein
VRETHLVLGESHHDAEIAHPHGREAVQANVRHDLNNIGLVGVDADKVKTLSTGAVNVWSSSCSITPLD